jgi:hypothetical protein
MAVRIALGGVIVLSACAVDRRGLNAVDAINVIGDGSSAGGRAGVGVGGVGGGGPGGTAGGGASGGSGGGTAGAGGTDLDAGSGGAGGQDNVPDSGTTGGTGGAVVVDAGPEVSTVAVAGCADGTREGYLSTVTYPLIAACAGGWSIAGMTANNTMTPQCGRRAGNNGMNTSGNGCSVADLCAENWHVCETAAEVARLARTCDDAFAPAGNTDVFYATRQRAAGVTCVANNNTNGTNNLHGCGNFGTNENSLICTPFPTLLTQTDCAGTPPWVCGENATDITELQDVTKTANGAAASTHGGVLCCHD